MPDPNAPPEVLMPNPQGQPTPDVGQASQQMPQYQPPQRSNAPPVPRPILADLFNAFGIGGKNQYNTPASGGQMARPTSRLDHFESFLGNFVQALGAGFANEGRGPGAAYRGAGAAMQAPYQQSLQNYQAQSQVQSQQAEAQLKQAQAQPVNVNLGDGTGVQSLPASSAAQVYRGYPSSLVSADAKRDVAAGQNATKMGVEQWKFMVQQGQISKVLPGKDEQGNLVMQGYNKQGKLIGAMPGALPPASYLPKSTDTVEYKQDADGNIVALPKQTTSGPRIPGRAGAVGPTSNIPQPKGSSGPRVVLQAKTPKMVTGTGPDGRQVAGTPAELRAVNATGITELPSGDVSKVSVARQLTGTGGLFDLAEKDLAAFKPGELENLAPRWNEFLAGNPIAGASDPRYIALRTHVNGLLGTAMMQAHVGSRGGENMMEHFADIANAGKMSQETLKAALGAERQYVEEKAMRPQGVGMVTVQIPGQPKGQIPARRLQEFQRKYPAARVIQ